jgi:hypothetical protein
MSFLTYVSSDYHGIFYEIPIDFRSDAVLLTTSRLSLMCGRRMKCPMADAAEGAVDIG